MTTVTPHTGVLYEERLRVPLRWWVQATMFVASVWLAFIVALPAVVAWSATAVLGGTVIALFVGYGAAVLRVADGEFVAGRARIPVGLLASPVALDAETTKRLIGVEANVRAFLLLRPYLKRSVQVAVVDPADPVPYWLVSTRNPDALVTALSRAAGGRMGTTTP